MAENDTTATPSVTTNSTIDYDSSYEDEFCMKTDVNDFTAIFIPIFFSIVVVFSVFGNILVIVILAKYENLKSLTNTFILNLAMSDLLFTAGLPFWIYSYMYGWTLGEAACKIVNFIFCAGFYSSGILLILMTGHRYIAVMYPLSDIVSTTGLYSVIASVVIWAASIFLAGPAFFFTTVKEENYCVNADSKWTLFGIYQQNVLFIISSMIFIFCYSQIICRLLRPTARRRKNKTLKLIFTLMVIFFVGWAPYNAVIFMKSLYILNTTKGVESQTLRELCETHKKLDYAFEVSRIFAYSHCCLNPVFYVFAGVKFKNHLKKLLKSWGKNKNTVPSRQSRFTIISVTSGEELSM